MLTKLVITAGIKGGLWFRLLPFGYYATLGLVNRLDNRMESGCRLPTKLWSHRCWWKFVLPNVLHKRAGHRKIHLKTHKK